MYKLVGLLLLTSFLFSALPAQDAPSWTISAAGGTLLYQGDMSHQRYPEIGPAWQLGLSRSLSPSFELGLSLLTGNLYGNDRQRNREGQLLTQNPDFSRSLNFRSRITEAAAQLTYRSDNGQLLPHDARIAPYLFAGMGLTHFRVFADLYHGLNQDQRYYYWQDGTIRDRGEGDAGTAIFVAQDGNYETDVTNIGTEAAGTYPTTVLSIPVGMGLRLRLSHRVALRLSAEVRLTFTDYLDDLSDAYKVQYPNEAIAYAARPADNARILRGDADMARDRFFFPAAGLEVRLGKIRKPAQSLVTPSQRDPDGLRGRGTKIIAYPDGSAEVVEVEPFEPGSVGSIADGSGTGFLRDTVFVYQTDTIYSANRMPDTVYKYIVLPAGPERTETHASESRKALQSLYEKLLALNEEMAALKNRNEQIDQLAQQGGPGATTRIRPDEAFISVFAPPAKEVLYYGFGEFDVSSPQQQRLLAIVSLMKENPSIGLLISGHADATGDTGVNLHISRLRAEAAAQYILRQSGIDPGRIITRYYGEAVPPAFTGAPNGSPKDERRVELDFIKIK